MSQTLLIANLFKTETAFFAIGIAGQVLFTLRILVQWVASEKAKDSVVPISFWWLSVAGTLLLLVYAWFTRDPIFLIAPTLNLFLYIRNLMIAGRGRRLGTVMIPLGAVMMISGGVAAYLTAEEKQILNLDASPFWLTVGLAGTALWTLRFPVQWIVSERAGKSVLPPVFWWMSIFGAGLLTAYAAYKPDAVFVLAYALNPIPAIRNLMLIYRKPKPAQKTLE
ncbi:MAG: lipid-A-disaccharide synthase N-terminal domain-containing protein [Planctomycetes bacterium]|nr:lipid-A-disaccharide synthase N-terminal domain-containing protein [Planctomycetota bacterium]